MDSIRARTRIGPSRQLVGVLLLVHFAAAGLFWTVELPDAVRWSAAICLLASLGYHLARHGLQRHPGSVVEMEWGREPGRISLSTLDGGRVTARVLASSFVAPYLTVINLKRDGAWVPLHVVITPDCLEADAFRKLRVWLRCRGLREPEGAGSTPGRGP